MQKSLQALAHWVPSEDIGEQSVRAQFIDPLLEHLGYDTHKDYEVWRDGDEAARFRLKATPVEGGAKKVRGYNPDYVPTVRKKAFWVIDAKRPNIEESERFVVQVLQYAVHPEVQARFGVLIDGRTIKVYDVRRAWFDLAANIYEPIFQLPVNELEEGFSELKSYLGNEQVRERLVDMIVHDYEKLCLVSLDETFPDAVLHRLRSKNAGLVQSIRRNKARVFLEHYEEGQARWKTWLAKADNAELLAACVMQDQPRWLNPGEELARRVDKGTITFEQVQSNLGAGATSLFVQHQYLLFCATLVRTSPTTYQSAIDEIVRLLRGPLAPINECEATLIRLIRKLRIVGLTPDVRAKIMAAQRALPERQRAADIGSVNDLFGPRESIAMMNAFPLIVRLGTFLGDVHEGLRRLEDDVDAAYKEARQRIPSGERMVDSLDAYGYWEPNLRWNLLNAVLGDREETLAMLPEPLRRWLGDTNTQIRTWLSVE